MSGMFEERTSKIEKVIKEQCKKYSGKCPLIMTKQIKVKDFKQQLYDNNIKINLQLPKLIKYFEKSIPISSISFRVKFTKSLSCINTRNLSIFEVLGKEFPSLNNFFS